MIQNLGDKTILIVNTLDERPMCDPLTGCLIRYQHGNVNVSKDRFSVGIVFRTVHRSDIYDRSSHFIEHIYVSISFHVVSIFV